MSEECRSDEVPDDELRPMLEQRDQVHRILAGNPNYFGNFPESKLKAFPAAKGNLLN